MTAPMQVNRVPVAAGWLGGLGLVPFVFCAGAAASLPSEWAALAARALGLYGAVILSFLGGIQWGLAISGSDPSDSSASLFRRLLLSVLPALLGWCALLLPFTYGLWLLALSFILVLVADLQAVRQKQAPSWYPRLRWPLTLVATAALIVGAVV